MKRTLGRISDRRGRREWELEKNGKDGETETSQDQANGSIGDCQQEQG